VKDNLERKDPPQGNDQPVGRELVKPAEEELRDPKDKLERRTVIFC
jgi:hypothetical protein